MPQIDFSGSHAISDSMKDLGAGLARFGHVLQYEAEQQRDADRAVFSVRWAADASKKVDGALTAMENTDYEVLQTGKFTLLKKLRETLLQDVQAEPDRKLRALKEKTYLQLDVAAAKTEADIVQRKRADWGKAGILQGAESALISFGREGDPAAQQKIADDHILAVMAAQQGGILSEQEAQAHLVSFNEKTLELRADGMIQGNRFDEAAAFIEKNRIMLGAKYSSLVGKVDRRKAEVAEAGAYADASTRWPDPREAMVEVLKPEFMQKHGLTINQSQNIAQSFSAIGTERLRAEKERQEKNLDGIREVAINNPTEALRLLRTAEDVDPKDALALQRSTESHIRQMSLMSAQEKAVRMDLEDKIKARIKADILAGRYKSERELTDKIIGEGLTNTSGFIDDALGTFRSYKKDAGSVNYFNQAEQDWDRLISTSKARSRKRELQDMKPRVLETLRKQMEEQGLRISDPKVFELYQAQRNALTRNIFQKALDSIRTGDSGDPFVRDMSGIMVGTEPAAQAPAAAPAVMSESTARKRLEGKGIKGQEQDLWIQRYRDEGVVK
jgi:hypothetical protein